MFEPASADEPLAAVRRLELAGARLYMQQSWALLQLWDSAAVGDAGSRVGADAQLLAELASLLRLSPLSVSARLAVALVLREHPLLPALMHAGSLGVAHLLVAVEEIGALGDVVLAERVLRAVLTGGAQPGWDGTPAELRRALRRTAVALDPAAAARRREEQAQQRTGVRLRPLPDGLAALVATGAAPQLTAASRLLGMLSEPAGPDDERTTGQRQVDALLGALVAKAGTAVELELQLNIPVTVTSSTPTTPTCPPEPVTIAADLTPELLAMLTGGAAPRAAQQVVTEQVASEPVASGPVALEPVTTEPPVLEPEGADPVPAEAGVAERVLTEPVAADSVTADPGEVDLEADPVDADQAAGPAVPEAAGPGVRRQRTDGVPELLDHGPVDPGLLLDLLTDPAGLPVGLGKVTIRRVCIDETGQAVAIDDTALPLARLLAPPGRRRGASSPAATSPPTSPLAQSPPPTPAGAAARTLARLLAVLPAPPPRTDAYVPTAAQQRLVRARNTTCTFPGCGPPLPPVRDRPPAAPPRRRPHQRHQRTARLQAPPPAQARRLDLHPPRRRQHHLDQPTRTGPHRPPPIAELLQQSAPDP